MFKCPVCGNEYESINEMQRCVNKCAHEWRENHKKEEEKKREEERSSKAKELKTHLEDIKKGIEIVNQSCEEYNRLIKEYNEAYVANEPTVKATLEYHRDIDFNNIFGNIWF